MGYTSGARWNGWATPYFTLEEAQKLQAEWNKGGDSTMLYDANKDEFVCKYEDSDEPYIWEGEDIKTEDGIKHLYGIGAYSHIWDELGDDDKRYLAQNIAELICEYNQEWYEDHFDCGDDLVDYFIDCFDNIELFANAHATMNNALLGESEIYTRLAELLIL
jgi:hypothetical protein